MKRGYRFKLREYIKYFILGIIVSALVLGSVALKATHPETQPCEPFITDECPNKMNLMKRTHRYILNLSILAR